MKNGDWMMYRAACAKDEVPKIQKDLFIGYSGGEWYFTTYHFCVGMLVAESDPQPASIEEFVQTYSVRKFDGKVENCLEPTWP